MLFYFTFFLSVIFTINIVFPQKSVKNNLKVNLSEKLTIGNNDSFLLLNARSILDSEEGSLFIADKLSYKITKLDSKGNLQKQIGKRGGKKSEFRAPDAMDIYNNYIAITDFSSPRIQIFTTELDYLRTIYAKGLVFDISFDKNGYLWVGSLLGNGEVVLLQYSISGKLLKEIKLKNSTEDEYEFEGIFHLTISNSNKIIVVHSLMNKIEIWNTNGNFLKEFIVKDLISKPPKKLFSSGLFSRSYLPEGNIMWDVAVDSNERIFIQGADYSPNPYQDIFVYSVNGNKLGNFKLPNSGGYIWINRSDELFTIEKKGTLIKKFTLK